MSDRGFQAARPRVQVGLGAAILVGCLWWGTGTIVGWQRDGGTLYIEFVVGFVTMALLGGWLAIHGLRRGLYLAVQTDSRVLQRTRTPKSRAGVAPKLSTLTTPAAIRTLAEPNMARPVDLGVSFLPTATNAVLERRRACDHGYGAFRSVEQLSWRRV